MTPYDSERGRERFAERLRSIRETCPECEFTDTILDSAWRTSVTEDPRSGHVTYCLQCPDCGTTTDVEISIP